jgi:CheY-like chemotaxis protein
MPKQVHRILIIDDDPVNNMINQRLIKKFNSSLEIETVMDATMALKKLESEPNNIPDLILLDINMPVMSGWEFLEAVKERGLEIVVVMLSSSIDKHDKNKSSSFPVVLDYLVKPLTIQRLKELFERHDFDLES